MLGFKFLESLFPGLVLAFNFVILIFKHRLLVVEVCLRPSWFVFLILNLVRPDREQILVAAGQLGFMFILRLLYLLIGDKFSVEVPFGPFRLLFCRRRFDPLGLLFIKCIFVVRPDSSHIILAYLDLLLNHFLLLLGGKPLELFVHLILLLLVLLLRLILPLE